jgi:uncharacterized protein YciI
MVARRTLLVAAAVAALAVATPWTSRADAPAESAPAASNAVSPALMAGLAKHAARFEDMKARGAFTMTGRMEEVDGDGHASDTKEIQLRSTPTHAPMDRITNVIRYTENGKDKTADAQKRATERRAKRLGDPEKQAEERKKDLKLPFHANEQSRYVFSVVERDAAQPSHVRIAFSPKSPAENAIKGSAWVDENELEVLSIGFSFSKNPIFVDHVDIRIVFGLPTELGRAPSTLSFDGRGGFLFIRKHYRGTATLSDPRVAF